MTDRRKYGLQLFAINPATREIRQFTPRNLNIAKAMIQGFAADAGDGMEYRIEDWSAHSEPRHYTTHGGHLVDIVTGEIE